MLFSSRLKISKSTTQKKITEPSITHQNPSSNGLGKVLDKNLTARGVNNGKVLITSGLMAVHDGATNALVVGVLDEGGVAGAGGGALVVVEVHSLAVVDVRDDDVADRVDVCALVEGDDDGAAAVLAGGVGAVNSPEESTVEGTAGEGVVVLARVADVGEGDSGVGALSVGENLGVDAHGGAIEAGELNGGVGLVAVAEALVLLEGRVLAAAVAVGILAVGDGDHLGGGGRGGRDEGHKDEKGDNTHFSFFQKGSSRASNVLGWRKGDFKRVHREIQFKKSSRPLFSRNDSFQNPLQKGIDVVNNEGCGGEASILESGLQMLKKEQHFVHDNQDWMGS